MNKFEFKGTVSFAKGKTKQDCIRSGERKNGGGEYKLLNFTLFNKKCGYVDCTTFDPVIIDNIQEGQTIELINYIPKKESWTNSVTGLITYRTTMNVKEVKLCVDMEATKSSSVSGWIDGRVEAPTITEQEVEAMLKRDEEVKQLEKLFDNLGQTQEVKQEEGQDSVNLDEVFLKL